MASAEQQYDVLYGTLKNFNVEKKIGKGQFSEVYRAVCIVNNVTLALKKVQVGRLELMLYVTG